VLLKKEPAIGDGSQSGRKRRQCKSIRGSVMCHNSHKWKETLAALVSPGSAGCHGPADPGHRRARPRGAAGGVDGRASPDLFRHLA